MKKSAQAFRTISEVAKVLDVPAHVLRFWESRFSQIKPVKRGGGRRYYRPEDVDLIRGIRNLLYVEGLTIKGAQKILRDKGVKHVVAIGRGEDAQIAEADALWDEPGAGDMAGSEAAGSAPAPASAASKRPAAPKAPDPRQTSLFGDDDLVDDLVDDLEDAPANDAPLAAPSPAQPPLRDNAPDVVRAFREPQSAPQAVPPAATAPIPAPASPSASVATEADDEALDQDALRVVFGKLKALRASMEDD